MISDKLRDRFAEIEKLAFAAGLVPYDIHYFEVPTSLIVEVASYGLPTRYSHWSFGRVYAHQRTQTEMGYSKIYELILNNDPAYAFLDQSNTETTNLLICAHCLGHADFFRNNVMFRQASEPNMIQVAKRHAEIVDEYRKDFGDDEVDEWLDVALGLERHIDVFKGLRRTRYPKRSIAYKERQSSKWEDIVNDKDIKPLIEKTVEGIYIPPYPEKDLLWFLSEYANLESWQQRIFDIVRRESYYFYPQYRTKIMNEGWASFWHAELMMQYALGSGNDYKADIKYPLTAEEHLDFVASHEKVVQPGLKVRLKVDMPEIDPQTGQPTGKQVKTWNPTVRSNPSIFSAATRLNPYYLGFKLFRDIKKRWDEYYEEGFREDEFGEKIPVTINGDQKIREVMEEEDDVSFLRNYLTEEMVDELHLFCFGNTDKYIDDYGIQDEVMKRMRDNSEHHLGDIAIDDQLIENKTIVVQSKKIENILQNFSKGRNNFGVPCIVIRRIDEAGLLRLEHVPEDTVNLDIAYVEYVLKYIGKVWGRPVELIRKDVDKTWVMSYDGVSVEIDFQEPDYPESVENNGIPSSW